MTEYCTTTRAKLTTLDTPAQIKKQAQPTINQASIALYRQTIANIIAGADPRILCVVGPCSIHNADEAIEYASLLTNLAKKTCDQLFIVMRVYLEKPRTAIGWQGFINDHTLTGDSDINHGITDARNLLSNIHNLEMPIATEFIDPIIPQYLGDLISYAAIGARTSQSQIHRQLASGLNMPIGFKNSTLGDVQGAINSIYAAQHPNQYLTINNNGTAAIAHTSGNLDCHLILRGSYNSSNYSKEDIAQARIMLNKLNSNNLVMIDCSHGNSNYDYRNQSKVLANIQSQLASDDHGIMGVMLESNLCAGSQQITNQLNHGQSITDGCIGWQETENILLNLADAIKTNTKITSSIKE